MIMKKTSPLSRFFAEMGVTTQLKRLGIVVLLACLLLNTLTVSSKAMPRISANVASLLTKPNSLSFTAQEYDMTIPSKYQAEYSSLQSILNNFNNTLARIPIPTRNFTFATELLPANGNRGPDLFRPGNLASVETNLNALQTMGVQGITLAIGYPLLDPTFPDQPKYLSYFQQVASMAHSRGMKVLVESQILFANTPYSPLTYTWANLPYTQFVINHIAQDQLIIDQIHPNYLEIGVEADTEAYLSGYSQLNTPSGWTNYIQTILSSLNKGDTKLVAGVGTWLGTSYLTGFANNPQLDCISTHVYPIYRNNLPTLMSIGKIAQQNGKGLVIDEAWAEKVLQPVTGRGAGTGIGGPLVTQQDVFSFWSPIDTQFLTLMAKFSQIYPVQFFSPFSEQYFFAYLNWTPVLDSQGYFQLKAQLDPFVAGNMASNSLTPTGEEYRGLTHATDAVHFVLPSLAQNPRRFFQEFDLRK